MSVIEILVVLCLSSVVLIGASIIMGRTTHQFKKGSDMLNTQVLLSGIVEQLRTDIRSLQKVIIVKPDLINFIGIREGKLITVSYTYSDKTLVRSEDGRTKDFNGPGQVEFLVFSQRSTANGDFQCLDVALQLKSHERGEGKPSFLSIFCQFYSKCLAFPTPY